MAGGVKIREGRIKDLIALYKATYRNISAELINATTAGQIQKFQVMNRINKELESLGVDVDKWVRSEIPQYYLDGANAAAQGLRKQGIPVEKIAGAATVNKQAIQALTDDVSLSFAEGIRGVGRNAQKVLNDTIKQQLNLTLAEGTLSGSSRRQITDALRQRIADEGLTALTDKSGRNWSLDTYSEMLARTKAVEARNQGLANRMLEQGYDLVEVTDTGSDHPACADWEGEILSLTGKTDDYPTLDDAEAGGLFHPNCEHAINVIQPELAAQTEAYDTKLEEYA